VTITKTRPSLLLGTGFQLLGSDPNNGVLTTMLGSDPNNPNNKKLQEQFFVVYLCYLFVRALPLIEKRSVIF